MRILKKIADIGLGSFLVAFGLVDWSVQSCEKQQVRGDEPKCGANVETFPTAASISTLNLILKCICIHPHCSVVIFCSHFPIFSQKDWNKRRFFIVTEQVISESKHRHF